MPGATARRLLLALLVGASMSLGASSAHAGQFVGAVPGPGAMGVLLWSGGSTEDVRAALASTSCSPRSLWTNRSGGDELIGYLYGAPDAVNLSFRTMFAGSNLPAQSPIILVCSSTTAVSSAATPAPTSTPPPLPPPSGVAALEQSEAQMLALVNQARVANGLPVFTLDPALIEVARRNSADMVARGYFSHINPEGLDPFARMAAAGITYTSAAENIAWAGDTTLAHEALMNSPSHRANLLNPKLARIGIGIGIGIGIVRKDATHVMVTQLFRN